MCIRLTVFLYFLTCLCICKFVYLCICVLACICGVMVCNHVHWSRCIEHTVAVNRRPSYCQDLNDLFTHGRQYRYVPLLWGVANLPCIQCFMGDFLSCKNVSDITDQRKLLYIHLQNYFMKYQVVFLGEFGQLI